MNMVVALVGVVSLVYQTPALKIVVIQGEDAVNVVQQKTAVAPIIEVRDRNDLPVAGATVVFTVNGSGGATFTGAQTFSVVTNAAGQATAAGLTPTAAGVINISATATFQGQTATFAISQSNVLTAPSANAAGAGGASTGGGIGLGKVIAIVGGIGAAGAGVAVDKYGKLPAGHSVDLNKPHPHPDWHLACRNQALPLMERLL